MIILLSRGNLIYTAQQYSQMQNVDSRKIVELAQNKKKNIYIPQNSYGFCAQ